MKMNGDEEESPSVYEILKKYGSFRVETQDQDKFMFYANEEKMQVGGKFKVNKTRK